MPVMLAEGAWDRAWWMCLYWIEKRYRQDFLLMINVERNSVLDLSWGMDECVFIENEWMNEENMCNVAWQLSCSSYSTSSLSTMTHWLTCYIPFNNKEQESLWKPIKLKNQQWLIPKSKNNTKSNENPHPTQRLPL